MDGFLKRYGPRLGVFALLLAVAGTLIALKVHFKNRQSMTVSDHLDAVLEMPEPADRIEPLKALLRENPGCDAEPLLLNCLGNQLYRKAEGLPPAEAQALNLEASAVFRQVYDRFQDHAAAPQALYSAGCCAEQLGREIEARRLYGELQERYPGTFLVGRQAEGSRLKAHIEGLAGRMRIFREAFPEGIRQPAPAATSDVTPSKP